MPRNGKYLTQKDFEIWNDYMGNLFHNKRDERKFNEFTERTGIARGDQTTVKTVTFVVTERCNLRCTYCYESHEAHERGQRMTMEKAKEIIDAMFDNEKVNGYYNATLTPGLILEFIGGEPLIEIDLIDYITDYFRVKAFELNHPWAYHMRISMTTNGVLYNTPKVQEYLEKNRGQIDMTITIDGNKALHDTCRKFPDGSGSYDIVEKAVRTSIEKGFGRSTKLTLAPENISHFYDAILNLFDLGLVDINANAVYEEGWEVEHASIMYKEMKRVADYILDNELYASKRISLFSESIGRKNTETKNYCGGTGHMLAYGADGRAYPCLRYMQHSMSTKGRKELCIGSSSCGLDNPKTSPVLKELLSVDMVTQSDDKCLNCPIDTGCGVCSALNYDLYGTANKRATFICVMHQARVLGSYYYFRKLYKKLNILNGEMNVLNVPKEWALEIISEKEYNTLINL